MLIRKEIPIKSTESSTNRYKNSLKVLKNTCIVFPKKFLEQCSINLSIYQYIYLYIDNVIYIQSVLK